MRSNRLFLLVYFLSGGAALLYEVVWLRLLTLSMGHTAAAVGIVLAAFMGGLAIGAWLGGRMAPSLTPDRALKTYAGLEVTIAACACVLPFALSAAGPVLGWAYQNGEGARLLDFSRAVVALVLLFVPTAAMGATYPIAVRWFVLHSESAAAGAGGLYAANTIGAAVGAALSGFVLLPLLGLRGTTIVGVALNSTAALGALWLAGSPTRHPRWGALAGSHVRPEPFNSVRFLSLSKNERRSGRGLSKDELHREHNGLTHEVDVGPEMSTAENRL